ncbi:MULTISPECIES: c-type cytochrome [Bradyrhizobium]|uniref:Cytochrome C n=1 Tax=Bradyrhizobium neotropicale TaxID=1497615 RepID=A0A176ZG34_9BRAD|nr:MULTISPECIES: c-type cytochrome [Bradyrhizobium]OAF18726.1 cytochrome C [Bradyrhizobium neotropicale]
MELDVRTHLRIKRAIAGSIVAAALLLLSGPTAASNVEQGRHLALLYCAKCHSTDKVSPSPLKIAPPFRTLHERYPVEQLQEALAEGIVTGHPTMPEFSFDADQVGDFIAFLKTLEK